MSRNMGPSNCMNSRVGDVGDNRIRILGQHTRVLCRLAIRRRLRLRSKRTSGPLTRRELVCWHLFKQRALLAAGRCTHRWKQPVGNFNRVEGVVGQGEKFCHRQHKVLHILQQTRIVRHSRRTNQHLSGPDALEDPLPVVNRNQLVLLSMDDQGRAPDVRAELIIGEPILEMISHATNLAPRNIAYSQEGRNENQTRHLVDRSQRNAGRSAKRSPK
mmetsp:Transcript_44254/g.117295  ORF Transcript_44254/g.117295 Transcript_44254/m.117295 type:complete len:216 (-) Transcript_44254:450-1097(-)